MLLVARLAVRAAPRGLRRASAAASAAASTQQAQAIVARAQRAVEGKAKSMLVRSSTANVGPSAASAALADSLTAELRGYISKHKVLDDVEAATALVLPATRAAGRHAASADVSLFHQTLLFAPQLFVFGVPAKTGGAAPAAAASAAGDDADDGGARFVTFHTPANRDERYMPVFSSLARLQSFVAYLRAGDFSGVATSGEADMLRHQASLLIKDGVVHPHFDLSMQQLLLGITPNGHALPSATMVLNPRSAYEYELPPFVLKYLWTFVKRLDFAGVTRNT